MAIATHNLLKVYRHQMAASGGLTRPRGATVSRAQTRPPRAPAGPTPCLNRGSVNLRRSVVVEWYGCDRSAAARRYLGARPCGRRTCWSMGRSAGSDSGRSVFGGTSIRARESRKLGGAGRKTGCHLGMVRLGRNGIGGGQVTGSKASGPGSRGVWSSAARACARSSATPGCARVRAP
jgi:hypothetical protein